MLALHACGKLELYGNVFDVDDFYRRPGKYLTILVSKRSDPHYREILDAMRENGVGIAAKYRVLGSLARIMGLFPGLSRRLKSVPLLRRLYKLFTQEKKVEKSVAHH